jgi:hypothetical protein
MVLDQLPRLTPRNTEQLDQIVNLRIVVAADAAARTGVDLRVGVHKDFSTEPVPFIEPMNHFAAQEFHGLRAFSSAINAEQFDPLTYVIWRAITSPCRRVNESHALGEA